MENSSPAPPLLQLPEDIIIEVLWRLPPKTLLRLRCVCKDLHLLMSSKRFIRSHLQLWSNHGDETGRNILVKPLFDSGPNPVSRGNRLAMELVGAGSLDSDRPHRRRLLLEESGLHWGGCCEGIICFYEFRLRQFQNRYHHRDVVIYICNPVLKQCRVISKTGDKHLFLCSGNTKVCLVLDKETEEYKVVLVSAMLGFSIFSLKTGLWKETDHHIGGITKTDSISDLVLHDESLHWIISGRPRSVLYALDFGREIIRRIKLPHDLLRSMNADGSPLVLVRYKGSLAVSSLPYFSWLMMKQDEDGVLTWKCHSTKLDLPCISCGADLMICDCGVWRENCRIPSAQTSFGCLMPYEDCAYVGNYEDGRVEHKFVIPGGRFNHYAFQKCIIADYVPTLASIFPDSQSFIYKHRR